MNVLRNLTFVWPCIVIHFLTINQLDAPISQIYFGMKLYMFRAVPLSIIRSFSLHTQQWYMSYMFVDSFRAWLGCSILILLASCLQTCMTYTIAVCTVKNSWKLSTNLYDIYHYCEYSEKLLIMDRGIAVPSWSCSKAVYKPVWHIPLLCVQWKTPGSCLQTCMTYTIAVSTVKNSW